MSMGTSGMLGMMFFFVLAALAASVPVVAATQPAVVAAVTAHSAWLGTHLVAVSWGAALLVALPFLAMPPKLGLQYGNTGSRLDDVGNTVGLVGLSIGATVWQLTKWAFIGLALCAGGYLVAIGWIAAQRQFG